MFRHAKPTAIWITSALLALVAAPASAGPVSDTWITSKVRFQLIRHPGIAPFAIGVDTQDGVVTLAGEVDAEVDKRDAARHAMTVSGVKDVRNELQVASRSTGKQVE